MLRERVQRLWCGYLSPQGDTCFSTLLAGEPSNIEYPQQGDIWCAQISLVKHFSSYVRAVEILFEIQM
jgi:hypothetical protein